MTVASSYRADPRILELGADFYDAVEPATFPTAIPRFLNRRWAGRVGLGDLDGPQWEAHFCRFEPLPDNLQEPLALRYHGHQFRVYNPDIGDGRGFLFAQLRDAPASERGSRLLDLGTKGSGTTPYSRTADGRLTLKGGVREVLATEMLEALGVNTSKSFALFETGEELVRGDEPSPTRSSVLTRLGHGHIRIGSFQRFAFLGEADNIDKLVRYCLAHLYGEPPSNDTAANALRLFDLVSTATAGLAASYMAAGFVHGVLNSDNVAITGESFDYGPWRFTPDWDPAFTAAYFDYNGLYAFGRQPEAVHWDLAQFAGSLTLVAEAPPLSEALAAWGHRFEDALVEGLLKRLGVAPRNAEDDRALAAALVRALQSREAQIDRIFFDWRGGRDPGEDRYPSEPFRALAEALRGRERPVTHAYWSDDGPCSMHIEEVEAIWAAIAERDDWGPFEAKIASVRRMGEAMAGDTASPA
ncbi:protein adenylyltransferase SelO family protein [Sphingomonas sp.]|uniref:protein adenylyltransferase SelO family protein n=1 Tax=Sphingomonas sp. TaxID=28214 RepID=UPI00180BC66F|nr:YdiU family protein [Sphingomonas sp.]MBA3511573.1 YdiU family protein [Sphingomonas sp.]